MKEKLALLFLGFIVLCLILLVSVAVITAMGWWGVVLLIGGTLLILSLLAVTE